MEELQALLTANNYRLTAARQSIFKALFKNDRPLDIAAIQQVCPTVNRSSIYRVLATFLKLNIVTEVPRDWKVRYELAEPFKGHHHHLQCQKCGEIVALDTPALELLINKLATNHSYLLTNHHIELMGVCQYCR
jgi:Fur family ferric uptake transcriptional regulator